MINISYNDQSKLTGREMVNANTIIAQKRKILARMCDKRDRRVDIQRYYILVSAAPSRILLALTSFTISKSSTMPICTGNIARNRSSIA